MGGKELLHRLPRLKNGRFAVPPVSPCAPASKERLIGGSAVEKRTDNRSFQPVFEEVPPFQLDQFFFIVFSISNWE